MSKRDSMRGMNRRERCRAPGRQAGSPDRPNAMRARMAYAALLSCALVACGGGGSSSPTPPGPTPPGPGPTAAQPALTVMAGNAGGGSVSVAIGFVDAGVVDAGTSSSVVVAGDTVTLTATEADGYGFAGWTLSGPPGLACADDPADNPCTLPAGSVGADATVEAAFEAVPTTLTVSAGTNGSVAVEVTVDGTASETNVPGPSLDFAFNVEATATLTANAAAGWTFAGWTLSGGLACADGPEASPCVLAVGSVTTNAEAEAAFVVLSTLTVTVGPNGSVDVAVGGAGAVEVGADSSQGFTVSVLSTATLTAVPAGGYAFTGWTLSGPSGLACASGAQANLCALPADSLSADATATATFGLRPPAAWRGPGSVSASPNGPTHTADPYVPGAFENWDGAPCDGSQEPACDVSSVMAGEGLPVAVFRPFVVGGIKSLAFGLGYHGDAPDHFEVSFRDDPGAAGFTPVPGFDDLTPGSGPARLPVSVHLLPWGLGAYMTEACDASVNCGEANGGRQTLKQVASVAATGYFKAPVAGANDEFGHALALSGNGATLAVGVPTEDSASTGTFAPGDARYQDALNNSGSANSGAVTVYRRSDSAWRVEAFVKAPVAGDFDQFGVALALSDDGATLAVGAPFEDSAYTGAFAPTDGDYQDALDSEVDSGNHNSGAVTVYRRSEGNDWGIEAFVKAPKTDRRDEFGAALALSADGSTLAVGARREDSASTGTFVPGDMGYQTALNNFGAINSGAVTVYRRSGSAWRVEAFIKAPKAGSRDEFGSALTLSEDSSTLAVGAPLEDSASIGAFTAPNGAGYQTALNNGDTPDSGAVTVYRRSGSAWRVEAFVKAPKAGDGDLFGTALALSRDGATLAVGAPFEDSTSTGTFALDDVGYQAALDNDGTGNSGAVTVYRRSEDNDWGIEAFVKAPKAGGGDQFGLALALSEDSSALAVGARFEDSASIGAFTAPNGTGYQTALDSGDAGNSGAVTVYRHPAGAGAWTVGNFVKAPNTGGGDEFGAAVALSGDGITLAVGALDEDGGPLSESQPVGGDSADAGNAVNNSGAVYLY